MNSMVFASNALLYIYILQVLLSLSRCECALSVPSTYIRLFFSTLVRILLALEKAGNLSFGHFYLSFFHFCPEFFVFFTEIPSIFAGNMGF